MTREQLQNMPPAQQRIRDIILMGCDKRFTEHDRNFIREGLAFLVPYEDYEPEEYNEAQALAIWECTFNESATGDNPWSNARI